MTKICIYPGCDRPAAPPHPAGGPQPSFCDLEQHNALTAYQEARHTLADELGIEPSPALRELERQILQQDAGLGPALPTGVTQAPPAARAEPELPPETTVCRWPAHLVRTTASRTPESETACDTRPAPSPSFS